MLNKPSSIAQAILGSYWDHSLPIDPIVIATRMAVSVFSLSTLDCDGLFTVRDGKNTIYYRPSGNSRRDRFTVAHELGHCCLGHSGDMHRDGEQHFDVNNYIPAERDANRFAATLLMPESALKFFVYNQGVTDIDTLCQMFDVSSTAMSIRLRQIGIL